MARSRVRASSSPAGGRGFLSLSFFSIRGRGERRKGRRRDKKNDALAANERTKFPECKRGTARSACALADCSTPRIDLSIVFERRRWRLPQTFVYKYEYRSSYRRLERLNAPHSSFHAPLCPTFLSPPPPQLIPLLDSCLLQIPTWGFNFVAMIRRTIRDGKIIIYEWVCCEYENIVDREKIDFCVFLVSF